MAIDPLSPPLLTADLPGLGGRIKVQPEDFEVEEIPAYEPSGSGDHLYLWLEKRNIGPEFFARTIAQKLGVPVGAVGTAGLKDRYAVTRQWVSVPKEAEPRLEKLSFEGLRIIHVSRHHNKLKPGHSQGNQFRILIRTERSERAGPILERIRTHGLPNYYGPQRFGRENSTLELGFECLAGRQSKRIRPFLYKFALSSVQSFLFNDYLGQRLSDGLFRTVQTGDVMGHWPRGGLFVAEDRTVEQERFDRRETVTMGPMFGSRTFPAAGDAADREAEILRRHGYGPATFANFGKLMGGTRRQNLIYLDDLTSQWEPDGLRLSFSLPGGSYATVLLAELMKCDLSASEGDAEGS